MKATAAMAATTVLGGCGVAGTTETTSGGAASGTAEPEAETSAAAEQSSGDPAVSQPEREYAYEADVVVVGSGAAGLMACASAHEVGASTFLIEKGGLIGGDTAISHQDIITFWPDQQMEDVGKADTKESYLEDWKKSRFVSQRGVNGEPEQEDYSFIERQLDLFPRAGNWTKEVAGVVWTAWENSNRCLPSPEWDIFYPRVWNTTGLVPAIHNVLTAYGNYGEVLNSEAVELLQDSDGRICGVKALDREGNPFLVKANKGVVLACGSFTANQTMIARYIGGRYSNMTTAGSRMNTGDGIRMAQAVGADLVDMGLGAHCLPTVLGDTTPLRILGQMSFFGNFSTALAFNDCAILVNMEGNRFMAESMGYSWLGKKTSKQPLGISFYVLDSRYAVDSLFAGSDCMMMSADTIEELAMKMNVDPIVFKETIDRYNGFVASGTDEDFGKPVDGCTPIDQGPFYALEVQPQAYATYGGIRTDVDSHVLDKQGIPISGLYAAGQCTGVFSEQEGLFYYGGVPQALAFGMQAGEKAAKGE